MGRLVSFPKSAILPAAFLLVVTGAARLTLGREVLPNSSKECAICHIRWVQALDRNPPSESTMQAVMEQQAGSGDMCLSCHDGSVVDSRFKVWSTRHHTTDAMPSPAVRIPTDKFPLDAQGRMTCATCHTAHAVPGNSDLRTVIFLRQPNVDSSLCLNCHPQHAQQSDFQHPLGQAKSPVPKAILDAGGKTSPDGHAIFCQTCHEPHGAQNAWMLVLPPSELCIACHTNKAPEASPPAGAPVHRIGHTYTGFKPPASLLAEKATFGPNGELSCLSCHHLHDASGAKPLLIRKNENSSLCLECHQTEKAILGSAHDLRVSSPEILNAHGEKPSASGPCGACHRIHGWARDVPETNRPHSSGCMECHKSGGPGSRNRPYVEAHPVGIAMPEGKSIPLPLDETTRDIGCLTCHDPHIPRSPEMAGQPSMGAQGPEGPKVRQALEPVQAPRSFLRREGSQLCVICHDEKTGSLPGPHDPAGFAPSLRETLGVHPAAGLCRTCHTAHNAQGSHLWARAPADTPAGPTSNFCTACHNGDLARGPQGTHHPLTLLSDSKSPIAEMVPFGPLSPSGPSPEVSCTSCHDPHGAARVVAQLRGPAENLCFACHEDKHGIKGSVHDPGAGAWGKSPGFVSKGLCLDCHPIHGPEKQVGIWRSLGGEQAAGNLCEACHRLEGPGPVVVTPHAGKRFDCGFQIADCGSKKPGDANVQSTVHNPQSVIRCATCHDIHQNAPDSKLLRAAQRDSTLCLACHSELSGLLGTSHDLRNSAPEARNMRGEIAAESGPCGVCHLVHPPSTGGGTWAQQLPPEGNHGKGLCTCCHGPGQCAQRRIPEHVDHPEVALFNRTSPGQPDYMPTFDEHGQPSSTGVISCPTCHQVHAPGSTPAIEGGALSSRRMLLRPAHQRLCTDCHGLDALWRFLYYHKASRNPRGRN